MNFDCLSRSMAKALRAFRKGCGLLLVMGACSSVAWAFGPVAPEIDPGSAVSSLALLAGGVMLVYDRYRR
jgi:hypothetical protein